MSEADQRTVPATVDDGFSWRHDLVGAIEENDAVRHFSLATSPRDDGKISRSPLVRGALLSLYIQECLDGQGETNLHAHADEAGWLVLEGEAAFYDSTGALFARVAAGEGLSIAPGVAYRYLCSGVKTVMVRAAARPPTGAR